MPSDLDTALVLCQQIEDYLADEWCPEARFCPVCLLAFPTYILRHPSALRVLRTRHHRLWDTCMRNLTAPLTAREHTVADRRLRHNMNHCPFGKDAAKHNDTLQRMDLTHVDDPHDLRDVLMCYCLRICLHIVDDTTAGVPARSAVNRARFARKRFRASNGAWPTSVDQFFPHGAACTVEGIVDCCCSLASEQAFWVLTGLLNLARPRVWNLLLEPETHLRICWAISTTLLLGIPSQGEVYALAPRHAPGCTIPPRWRDAQWLRDGITGLEAVATLLKAIDTGTYARPDDKFAFVAPHAEMLGHALRTAALHYNASHPEECTPLRHFVGAVNQVKEPAPAPEETAALVARDPRGFGLLRTVRVAISWLRCDRRCAAHGCRRTMLDRPNGEDKPLPLCSRCTLARYCSRDCQRADWTRGKPCSHRALCAVLVRLQETVDIYAAEDEFVRCVRHSSIPDAQLALVGRWALSLGQHMGHMLRMSSVSVSSR